MKRCLTALLLLCVLISALWVTAFAGREIPVLEQKVSDAAITLYIQKETRTGGKARIGLYDAPDAVVSDEPYPIVTWLLIDNSLSISAENRELSLKLLRDTVAASTATERFTLCTISDRLCPLLQESSDEAQLLETIGSIQYMNQETYLTDVLDELLAYEQQRDGAEYVRVVVISDGVDNNPEGITRDELEAKLNRFGFPIYSVGCQGIAQELKEMYALSRQTNAKYWSLQNISDTREIAAALSDTEIPSRIVIPIPEQLRDGTEKAIRVTFDDGSYVQTHVEMPLSEQTISLPTSDGGADAALSETTSPAPEKLPENVSGPEQDTEPVQDSATADGDGIETVSANEENYSETDSASEPESGEKEVEGSDPLLVKKIIAAALLVSATVFFLLKRRKRNGKTKQKKAQGDSLRSAIPGTPSTPPTHNKTVYMGGGLRMDPGNNKTVYMGGHDSDTNKADSPKMTVSLRDVRAPDTLFEILVPMKQEFGSQSPSYEVTIGRALDNSVVIDYNKTVSAHHCKIIWHGNDAQVYDLRSKNGTSVNGTSLSGDTPAVISNGSMLKIGEVSLRLEYRANSVETSVPTLW